MFSSMDVRILHQRYADLWQEVERELFIQASLAQTGKSSRTHIRVLHRLLHLLAGRWNAPSRRAPCDTSPSTLPIKG